MKIETLGLLVDDQPLFQALAEYKDQSGLYDKATRVFLRRKILATCKQMMSSAKYIRDRVKESDLWRGDSKTKATEEQIAAIFDKSRPIEDRLRDLADAEDHPAWVDQVLHQFAREIEEK